MKISEMMNMLEEDTIRMDETDPVDSERIKTMVRQRMDQALPEGRRPASVKKLLALAVAAAMVLSLGTTALASARGISVTQLLGGYFHAELDEKQKNTLEELGTTDFSGAQEEMLPALEEEQEELPTFVSVIHDGVTITPLAAVFDGYRLLFKVKIALPEGQVIEEEDPDRQYDLLVNLHIMDQVWVPAPALQEFSKEGCEENEIVCMQDWQFCGQQVFLPDTIDIVGMETTDHTTAGNGMIFGEDKWTVDISSITENEEVRELPLTDIRYPVTIHNSETDAVIDTEVRLTHVTISPLNVRLSYDYGETLPYEITARCGSDFRIIDMVAVMQDGKRIPFSEGMGDDSPEGGWFEFQPEEPLFLPEVDHLEVSGVTIPVAE